MELPGNCGCLMKYAYYNNNESTEYIYIYMP